ncbi:hypothetical protein T439DRAFT_356804 [Meredithblackwellia eburnea MCA 4105]
MFKNLSILFFFTFSALGVAVPITDVTTNTASVPPAPVAWNIIGPSSYYLCHNYTFTWYGPAGSPKEVFLLSAEAYTKNHSAPYRYHLTDVSQNNSWGTFTATPLPPLFKLKTPFAVQIGNTSVPNGYAMGGDVIDVDRAACEALGVDPDDFQA